MDIDFIGEPPPDVTWSNGNVQLKTDERTTITSIGYHTIVHTVNCKRADSGTYSLMLKNNSGVDEGSFQLIVLGKIFLREAIITGTAVPEDSILSVTSRSHC